MPWDGVEQGESEYLSLPLSSGEAPTGTERSQRRVDADGPPQSSNRGRRFRRAGMCFASGVRHLAASSRATDPRRAAPGRPRPKMVCGRRVSCRHSFARVLHGLVYGLGRRRSRRVLRRARYCLLVRRDQSGSTRGRPAPESLRQRALAGPERTGLFRSAHGRCSLAADLVALGLRSFLRFGLFRARAGGGGDACR